MNSWHICSADDTHPPSFLFVGFFVCFVLFFVLLFPLYPHPLLIFQNPAGIIYLWQAVNRGGADVFRDTCQCW